MQVNNDFQTDLGRFLGQALDVVAHDRPELDMAGDGDGWDGVRRVEMVKLCKKFGIEVDGDRPATEIRPIVRAAWLEGRFPIPSARDVIQEKVVETLKAMGLDPANIPAPAPGPGRPRKVIAEPDPDPLPAPEEMQEAAIDLPRYYAKRGFGGFFIYDRGAGDHQIKDTKHKSRVLAEETAANMNRTEIVDASMAGVAG